MKLLTRDDIINATDLKTEEVPVPEWGGKVLVKTLNGTERDRFEASITSAKGKKVVMNTANIRARLVAMTVVDENGKPLFKQADIEALGAKSASGLDRVFSVALRLAGMKEEDIDELTENFP